MKIIDLFRPRWRHSDPDVRLAAVDRITNPATLRKIARRSTDERLRLEAGKRLADLDVLRDLARWASDDTLRLEAALFARDESCLTAFALGSWSIAQGQIAVAHIRNPLLLRRVARSAKQDTVRLGAALKLDDPNLLRQVARSSTHIDVHWQVARRLNDLRMMADIAFYKPGNVKAAPIRREARRALIACLDRYRLHRDHAGLRAALQDCAHPMFKLEAFVRLPPGQVTLPMLLHLSSQEMRRIPRELLDRMLARIQQAGWQTRPSRQKAPCRHCQGSGALAYCSVSANATWRDNDGFPCPECEGEGQCHHRRVTCERDGSEIVTFRFPE